MSIHDKNDSGKLYLLPATQLSQLSVVCRVALRVRDYGLSDQQAPQLA